MTPAWGAGSLGSLFTPAAAGGKTGGTPSGGGWGQKAQKPAALPRYLNKATGKMETAANIRAVRTSAAAQALGAPKVTGRAASKPVKMPGRGATGGRGASGSEVPYYEETPGQIRQGAKQSVRESTNAVLAPFRAKGAEIQAQGTAAQNKAAGYGNTALTLLQGIQAGGEGAALTADNQAANATLAQAKAVETSGQASADMYGGALGQQQQAQLAAERGNIAAVGGARLTGTEQRGADTGNYLGSFRAAAIQRGVEGADKIAGTYGKAFAENQGKEGELLAKEPGEASKLAQATEEKAFEAQATRQKLRSEGVKLGNETARVGNETSKTRAENEDKARKLGIEEASLKVNQEHLERSDNIAAENLKKGQEERTGKLTTDQQNKIFTELGAAYNRVAMFRRGAKKHPNQVLSNSAIRAQLASGERREEETRNSETHRPETEKEYKRNGSKGKLITEKHQISETPITNSVLVTAAIEIYDHHAISASTRAQLAKQGYEPGANVELFNEISGR